MHAIKWIIIPYQPIDDDDGLDDYEGEFDFITENSQPDLVQQVIREFIPVNGDGNTYFMMIKI